jgi:ankyrin repeat protein
MMQTLVEVGSPIDEPAELDGLSQMHAMLNALRSKGSENDSAESDTDADYESDAEELLMASFVGDAIAVSRQLAAGTNVNYENEEGRTALMMALAGLGRGEMSRRKERDFEQVIDTLLLAGADPNSGMMSPLIIASTTGRLHLVNALIRAGADVNATADLPTAEEDETMLANALFVALSQNEHEAHVDERIGLSLVRAGVDLSFTSDDGSIAAHCAAKAGMTNTLREMLDLAPEAIDAQDKEGSTPLMLAAGSNRIETVRVLIERQADLGICDVKGRTAADHATANGHAQIADALNQ